MANFDSLDLGRKRLSHKDRLIKVLEGDFLRSARYLIESVGNAIAIGDRTQLNQAHKIVGDTLMVHASIQIIRDEHVALAAMLRSLREMVERGPGASHKSILEPENYFEVMRAMLFYIDEFPDRLHHPKESDLLFPRVARMAPETADIIVRLEQDHSTSVAEVRNLQHLLLCWELLGDSRRPVFQEAVKRFLAAYLKHMLLEETVILPAAIRVFNDSDWEELDAAFATNCDPLTGKYPRDPAYEKFFARIVLRASVPEGAD